MNNELLNLEDFDIEVKQLLDNIENMSPNIDLYSVIIDEKLLLASV